MERLGPKGQACMYLAEGAVLDNHIIVGSVVAGKVGIRALAALEHHSVIVDMHVASSHKHMVAGIDVDGIGTGCSFVWLLWEDAFRRGFYMAVEVAHMVALVDMSSPERTVLKGHILKGHVRGIGYIHEARTLRILVGALRIPLASYPELPPVVKPVAVYGSTAGNGEMPDAVGIDKRRKIVACLTFYPRLHDREVFYAGTAFQHGIGREMEMGALTEEE